MCCRVSILFVFLVINIPEYDTVRYSSRLIFYAVLLLNGYFYFYFHL